MEVINQLNTKINHFIEKGPKKAFLTSVILKIVSFSFLIFRNFSFIFFSLASLSLISFSFFIDLKIYDKIDNLLFFIFPNSEEEDPHKTGIHIGIVIGLFFKKHFFQRMQGIFLGIKKSL